MLLSKTPSRSEGFPARDIWFLHTGLARWAELLGRRRRRRRQLVSPGGYRPPDPPPCLISKEQVLAQMV